MKKKIIRILAFSLIVAASLVIFSSTDSYAGCTNANNYITMSSSISGKNGFSHLGGDSMGSSWACSGSERGIIYLYNSITKSGGVSTVNSDIEVDLGKAETEVKLGGIVYSKRTSSALWSGTIYAGKIGFCLKQSDCNGTSASRANINTSAVKGTAGGIFKSYSTDYVLRRNSSNPANTTYGNWNQPISTSYLSLKINNAKLKEKIDNNSVDTSHLSKNADGSMSGYITIYAHRCMAVNNTNGTPYLVRDGSGSGAIYGDYDTCASNPVDILIKKIAPPPPAGWTTTFDGKVEHNANSVTTLKYNTNDKKYHTSASSVDVTFTHYVKRVSGGPSTAVNLDWKVYHDSGNDKTIADKNGPSSLTVSTTFSKADENKHTYTLAEGGEETYCEALSFVTKVVNDGTTNTNGDWVNPMKEQCVTVKRDDVIYTQSFDGKIGVTVSDATLNNSDGIYYTDSASPKASFNHQIKRTDKNGANSVSTDWQAWFDKKASDVTSATNPASSADGSKSLGKDSAWTSVKTNDHDFSLNPGDKATYCETLGWYKTNTYTNGSDALSNWDKKQNCVTVKRYESNTFSGTVTPEGCTVGSDGKCYIDADKISLKFTHTICRLDTYAPDKQKNEWQVWYNKRKSGVTDKTTPTPSKTGTETNLGKSNTADKCKNVEVHEDNDHALNVGDNTICETLGYYTSVYHNGTMGTWDKEQGCVTVHRYAWYDIQGRVTTSTDATKKGDIYWTDGNTANLRFFHQFHTDTSVNIKPKYKTSKNPNPGDSFRVTGTDYVLGTAINKNSGTNGWYNEYPSPRDNSASVNVDVDTGKTYCQTLDYYKKVREDSADHKSPDSTSACVNLKRYKTTFTGSTKIYLNNSTDVNYANNGEYVVSTEGVTQYPVKIPVTFEHTVTRNAASNEDPYDSPTAKPSNISTNIFDGTRTVGYRAGDPHGSSKAAADTKALAAGESSEPVTDTFEIKIYPEQTITLCQQMTYYSELQGADYTKKNTKGNMACVTISMGEATCMDSQKIGVKGGKNYMKVDIFKNNSTSWDKSSGILSDGNTTITSWAKPGDQIRFNYSACAGGDLAQQYDVNNNKTTTYKVETDAEGYLFGDTLSSSPYTATSKEIGKTNSTVGLGPFSGKVYTYDTTSPHGNGIYSCNYYTGTSISDFYRIPAYISGLTPSSYRDSCKSDDYGRVSDLGESFKQVATWTDTQYLNGSPISGHNGNTATVTAVVNVPYNYTTKIDTSGQGGYLIPGSEHTEEIKLKVEPRKNTPANGSDQYSTVTKTTKYRLIEIVIGSGHTGTSTNFNNLVNQDTDFPDSTGNREPGTYLTVCRSGFTCNTVKSGNGKRYDPSNNTADGQTLDTYTRKIPYDIEPGVKYCYIAAVWPSDSHNLPNASDLTEADNSAGLVDSGTYWHVSGATCFTVAKRPSFAVLGGDTYAQNYISARVQKYASDNAGNNPRIYGSWGEYAAIAGNELKGFASGATLWGGSNIVSNTTDRKQNCAFSAYTFANSKCSNDNSQLGKMKISKVTSSNPETIANQIITRYTRTDDTGAMTGHGNTPIPVKDGGICKYDATHNTYAPYDQEAGATFACIGDTGAKYTHVKNGNGPVAYVPNDVNYCMGKGDTNSNRTSIIHADGTLVIGTNIAYGNIVPQSYGQQVSPAGLCYEDYYNSISEIPQSIFIAKKIIIKDYVTHIDSWLIADEIITCDPVSGWNANVKLADINTKNCNRQLTVNGPVMTKDLKLYRTYGTGFTYSGNYITSYQKATPAEYFTMGPEVYLWSFNQAQRYSQATTTYARELAPRY